MKVMCIFELLGAKGKLYAVQFEGEELNKQGEVQHAFSKLRSEWSDPNWFRSFFKEFRQDYYHFYGSDNLNSLVKEALEFADDLFEDLASHAISGDLDSLFKPLENIEKGQAYEMQKLKAKGLERKSYLRIYAVRFRDEFVITGGAIKLTRSMKDRPHTKSELVRLEAVVQFLKQNKIEGKIVYLEK
jgi:hypothetical protein